MKSFQDIIFSLHKYWGDYGCAILQPYDIEVGAGTFSPATLLRALGKKSWKAAYVQPSRRPADGRYGENPNRVQKHHQFQAVIKPSPDDIQDVYLKSLEVGGIYYKLHDIRFVEDDWESPTLGASGLGFRIREVSIKFLDVCRLERVFRKFYFLLLTNIFVGDFFRSFFSVPVYIIHIIN